MSKKKSTPRTSASKSSAAKAVAKKKQLYLAALDHDDLTPTSQSARKEFDVDSGGTLTVEWTLATPKAPVDAAYTGTLKYTPAAGGSSVIKLSCYNIGLQGRRLAVELQSPPVGRDVQLFRPKALGGSGSWEPASNFIYPLTIEKTGFTTGSAGKFPPNPLRVWGISFDGGICQLDAVSKRILHSPMTKASHDTSPPPEEPGGQDGE